MSTMETLFKDAVETMDKAVFVPTVMAKLAERGYTPETEEEAVELLKCAAEIRDGIVSGELSTVPLSAMEEDGSLSKQASEAVNNDPLAFAPEFEINHAELDDNVKSAAAVLTWATLKNAEQE